MAPQKIAVGAFSASPLPKAPGRGEPLVYDAVPKRYDANGPTPTTWRAALDRIAELERELARLRPPPPTADLARALWLAVGDQPFTSREVIEAATDIPELAEVLAAHQIGSARRLAKLLPACGFQRVALLHGAAVWAATTG